jgi:hypothetical protein
MPAVGVQFSGNPAQLLQAYNQIYTANVKMQQQYQQLAQQQQNSARPAQL